jgi:butyryl-CoA dehydrogenase
MNFNLSEEELELKQMARDFAEKRLYPNGEKFDEEEKLPDDLLKEAAELGYYGLAVPEDHGGLGSSCLGFMAAIEELSGGSAAFGMMLSAHSALCCEAIVKFGSDSLKEKYLAELAAGEKIGACAITEPNAGTDLGAIESTAVLQGDHYVINGTKAYVTNGSIADVLILFAKTGEQLSCFVVDQTTAGITVAKPETKCGVKPLDTRSLTLENVKVPKENLLGKESDGNCIAAVLMNSGRLAVAFHAIGIAQAAFVEATNYSQQRYQFDRPIAKFQAIQFKLSEMATRIEAGRLLACRAAKMVDENQTCDSEISMAKLFCSETANYVCDQAVQIHGGYGYIKEYAVERYFRDARATETNAGTSEAQRIVIASDILKDSDSA